MDHDHVSCVVTAILFKKHTNTPICSRRFDGEPSYSLAAPRASTTEAAVSALVISNGTTRKRQVWRSHADVPWLCTFHSDRPYRRARTIDDRTGHEREPPRRVQPSEVTAGQSSSTDHASKMEKSTRRQIETHPKRIPVQQQATLSHLVSPGSHVLRQSGSYARFSMQISKSKCSCFRLYLHMSHFYARVLCNMTQTIHKHRSFLQHATQN